MSYKVFNALFSNHHSSLDIYFLSTHNWYKVDHDIQSTNRIKTTYNYLIINWGIVQWDMM